MLLHKDKSDFLNACYRLIEKVGKKEEVIILGSEIQGTVYDDELIYIALSDDHQLGEVKRKTTDHSIIYIQYGTVIYFHPDYIYLLDHVNEMLLN